MNVIVLKSNEPSTTDRYVDFLNAQNSPLVAHVQQINLLKFSYQNLDLLKSKLFSFFLDKTNYEHYVHECFKCLIITSRQTVESLQRVLDVTVDQHLPSIHIHSGLDNNSDKLLVYCVGEATANRFKQLIQSIKKVNATVDTHLILRCVSDHKQNARELFKLIKQDYELVRPDVRSRGEQFKYALYPCSRIRRDDLSNSLSENGISFEEIHVYDTVPCDIGKQKLNSALNKLQGPNVLVFFSPSGCDCVFKDHDLKSLIYSRLHDFKLVSVGPTTSSHLRQYIDPTLTNELAEPSPMALWQSILKISNQNLNPAQIQTMSASVSRERRQTRSSTALNNSNLESSSEYSSKRKLSNKDPIDSDQFKKSHRTKVLSPNENELSTVKPKFIKEKINGDQNVLKSVNNPETSASNVSSSSSSTSASSDSKPTSVSTRRRSANLLNQMSSASLDQLGPASRKRNLSTSQEVKNENENEPCSQSANASSSGVSGLVQSASSSSLNKRIKLKHKYAFKELNENTNSPTTFRLMSKDEYEQSSPYGEREDASLSEINEADEIREDDVKESLVCPVLGCKSDGHVNGISEHHYSYDTCPMYFLMSKEECTNIHDDLDKRLAEIKDKTSKYSEKKKNLRNKHICKEQSLYLQKINKELKNLVKLPESNKLNKQSKLNFLKNADFVSDLKNLSTSFIINSLSNCLYTSPTPVSHYALLKHTSNESLSFFTNLNQTIAQTPDLNDLKISQYELDLFKDVLVSSTKEPIPAASNAKKLKLINKSDKIIQFGNHEIETWYKSPYPDDYWQLNKIFICQYCLTFMKSHSVLNRHLEKCLWRHPPGREIYRKDNLSFFEVDGKINKIYCQNLCLLAKLFIDHKTLYYEVEPFLFYVLTQYNEENGSFQMIGYFSKEKQSVLNYNLSCILILPQYMNQGYGRVLIDFSYLLSRAEGKVGSPERPLSDLGLISYRSYWKSKLLLYLSKHLDDAEISVKEITAETAILTNDLISTLQYIGLIKYWKGKHVILKDVDYIQRYVEKKNLYSRDMDEVCLKWSPYVYQPIISESGVPGKNLVKNNKTCLPSN